MSTFLEQLSSEDAKSILRILSEENSDIADRIEELAEAQLSKVDEESVADEVYRG